ncbi:MAG TPA: response regulator transcription factor [Puia sp.]|nr:response regulator transcription factor [Puia sp.]
MSVARILFIEPDPVISARFGPMLEDQQYDVDWADGGAGTMALLPARHFDLVLLDHRPPGMDGCELCRSIRKINDTIPLMMLAPAGMKAMMEAFAAGADDYLPLPMDGRELVARIRVLIKRALPAERKYNLLKIGDIVLDNDSKEVCKGGKRVPVTASEFLLLEYMMKNKNRIVTREELAAGAWKEWRRNKPGSLSLHMNNLRKKLKDDHSPHLLYTVSGKGYLLAEN